MTGRFAAPEIVGRLAEGPPLTEVYFAQPPLYTFLFGVYTKLVGFGPRRCILYDVLIHLLLVWSSVIAAKTVFRLPWSLAVLCGAISIPLGTVGRSDELGIVFLLWAAVTFSGRILRRSDALLGGGLIGLCGVTSLSALVFLGPLIVWELLRRKEGMSGRVWNFSLAVAAGFISAAVCVAPILFNHPTAYKQIIEHAGGQSGVLSSLVNGAAWKPADGLFHVWAEALWYGPEYGILVVGLLGTGVRGWRPGGPAAGEVLIPMVFGLLAPYILRSAGGSAISPDRAKPQASRAHLWSLRLVGRVDSIYPSESNPVDATCRSITHSKYGTRSK